jgi:hypothetical protein
VLWSVDVYAWHWHVKMTGRTLQVWLGGGKVGGRCGRVSNEGKASVGRRDVNDEPELTQQWWNLAVNTPKQAPDALEARHRGCRDITRPPEICTGDVDRPSTTCAPCLEVQGLGSRHGAHRTPCRARRRVEGILSPARAHSSQHGPVSKPSHLALPKPVKNATLRQFFFLPRLPHPPLEQPCDHSFTCEYDAPLAAVIFFSLWGNGQERENGQECHSM